MSINILRSEKFTITITNSLGCYCLLLIQFWKDGSIFISFPYYKRKYGWVGLFKYPGDGERSHTYHLEETAKITSHLVKYSYHPDGTTLFSQDRQIYSCVRKKTVPLNQLNGQMATIQAQNIIGFKCIDNIIEYAKRKRRIIINFAEMDPKNNCYKFVFDYYSLEEIKKRMPNEGGPYILAKENNGKVINGFLLSSPIGYPLSDFILSVRFSITDPISEEHESVVVMIGGYDESKIVRDRNQATSFLLLSYPVINYDDMVKRVESIDYGP